MYEVKITHTKKWANWYIFSGSRHDVFRFPASCEHNITGTRRSEVHLDLNPRFCSEVTLTYFKASCANVDNITITNVQKDNEAFMTFYIHNVRGKLHCDVRIFCTTLDQKGS